MSFIGRRGDRVAPDSSNEACAKFAKEVIQLEMLPHVGNTERAHTHKAYFLGYMVHKLLYCAMGRRQEDDRDHYGNKRLDMAGPLLAGLFRQTFRLVIKQVNSCKFLFFQQQQQQQ